MDIWRKQRTAYCKSFSVFVLWLGRQQRSKLLSTLSIVGNYFRFRRRWSSLHISPECLCATSTRSFVQKFLFNAFITIVVVFTTRVPAQGYRDPRYILQYWAPNRSLSPATMSLILWPWYCGPYHLVAFVTLNMKTVVIDQWVWRLATILKSWVEFPSSTIKSRYILQPPGRLNCTMCKWLSGTTSWVVTGGWHWYAELLTHRQPTLPCTRKRLR